jgi:hypothetical protein
MPDVTGIETGGHYIQFAKGGVEPYAGVTGSETGGHYIPFAKGRVEP